MVGRHNQKNANNLVAGIRERSDGHLPLFTSDELKHDDDALLSVYGIRHEFPKTGKRGRPRKPILIASKKLEIVSNVVEVDVKHQRILDAFFCYFTLPVVMAVSLFSTSPGGSGAATSTLVC